MNYIMLLIDEASDKKRIEPKPTEAAGMMI